MLLAALFALFGGSAPALDNGARKLAERYLLILNENPGHQSAFERIWKIYAEAGEVPGLIEICREQAGRNPVLYARVLARSGDRAGALKMLGGGAAADPVAAEVMADLLEKDGRLAEAAEVLAGTRGARESPVLLVRQGDLLAAAGQMEKARAAWESAAALAPRDLELRRRLAASLAARGEIEGAAGHLEVVTRETSGGERMAAFEEISALWERAGRLVEAAEAQEAALALMGPDHWNRAAARRKLFELRGRSGTLPELEKKWLAEAAAQSRDPFVAEKLSEFYAFVGGRLDDRLRWLRAAAGLSPEDHSLTSALAAAELRAGHLDESKVLYERILARRPDDRDAVFLRAEISALMGAEADAEARIEEFVSRHPEDESLPGRAIEFYRRLNILAPLERRLTTQCLAAPAAEGSAMELARHLLSQRRDEEASAWLARFDRSRLSASESSAAAGRISRLFEEFGSTGAALKWARIALADDPGNPDSALRVADLLKPEEKEEVLRVLREACEASAGPPREDLERRLFLAVGGQDAGSHPLTGPSPEVRAMFERIVAAPDTEAKWIRLARWHRWLDAGPAAGQALRRGLEAHPDSVPLLESLAAHSLETGDPDEAIALLKRLAELVPARAVEWQRQVGHVEIDRGNIGVGLAVFDDIRRRNLKDSQAAADLALAQQRAGNWFEAFETWQAAYELSAPEARRTARAAILNAATRLQLHRRALEFLERACAGERDPISRDEIVREASAYAAANGALEDWRRRLEARARSSPPGSFWSAALSEGGRPGDIATAGEDSPEVAEGLLKAAEEAEDWEEAVRLARRLEARQGPSEYELSVRLAGLLEKADRLDEAEAVWQAIAGRHTRSPEALALAGHFFDRLGDPERMEECFRAAARFAGCPPHVHLRLGRLALRQGERSQALASFEALLSSCRPKASTQLLPIPERIARVANSYGQGAPRTAVPSESDPAECRLVAIRESARLLARSPRRAAWLKQFSDPVERVWAGYYSGEIFPALDAAARVARGENAPMEQSLSMMALEAGEYDWLGLWASSAPAAGRWENVVAATGRLVTANWEPRAIGRLFAWAPAIVRWKAAEMLAGKGRLKAACELGETVPRDLAVNQAANAWMEIARWHLELNEPEAAVACLDHALESSPPSRTFADRVFGALRARWLLTPESGRPDFENWAAELLARARHGREAALALFAALRGRDASPHLARLVADLGSTEDEGWPQRVQEGGRQLEDWKLWRPARDLYRIELSRDAALLALKGESRRAETEKLLIVNQVATASPPRREYLLNEWLARGATDDDLVDAIMRLQQAAQPDAAAAVYARLCARDPRADAISMTILNLAPSKSMRAAGLPYFERLAAEGARTLGIKWIENSGLRFAIILDEDGEPGRALALLQRLRQSGISNKLLLLREVQILGKLGRHREALAVIEASSLATPTSPELTRAQAELLAGFGREREAQLLEKSHAAASPEAPAPEGAEAGGPQAKGTTPETWLRSLRLMRLRANSPAERFQAGRKFLAGRDVPPDLRDQEVGRLIDLAAVHSEFLPEAYLLRKEIALRDGETERLRRELENEWDSGRGAYLAGEILLDLDITEDRPAELARHLHEYLSDRHYHERAWDRIAGRLLETNRPVPAARVLSELTKRSPGGSVRAMALAEALWKSGDRQAAEEIFERIARIAALDQQKNLELAGFLIESGSIDAAAAALRSAPEDPRATGLWVRLGESFERSGRLADAHAALACAAKFPQALPVEAIADHYAKAGSVPGLDPDHNEFRLPAERFRDLQIEVGTRLEAEGRRERAWLWAERAPNIVEDPRGQELLRRLEISDWERASAIWEASESPLWSVRCGVAEFLLRRSRAESPAIAMKLLAKAHERHPGSYAIAEACVKLLVADGKPEKARSILQSVITAFASPADRKNARDRLASLLASPPLPKGG